MKLRILIGSISLLFFTGSIWASSPSERQFEVLFEVYKEGSTTDVVSSGYLIYYPEDYEVNTNEDFPVVLSLHGNGENGTSPSVLASKSTQLAGMVNNNVNYPFIIVSPLARFSMDSLSQDPYLEQVMAHVRANNRIDITAEYVAGLSQGGKGARRYAERNTDFIAGLVSAAGYSGGDNIQGLVDNNVPIILSHNENDGTISINSTMGYYNKLIAAGATEIILDIEATGGHNAWSRVFSNMDYWDWLLSIPNQVSGISLASPLSNPSILSTTDSQFSLSVEVTDSLGDTPGIDYVNADLTAIGGAIERLTLGANNTYFLDVFLDTGVTAGKYELVFTAVDFDANEKSTSLTLDVQVPPNDVPTVEILSPVAGEHVVEGDTVTFSIQANDTDGTIQSVQLYVNDTLAGTATLAPFDITVADFGVGLNSVYALATDNLGTQAQTDAINVIVDYLNSPPAGVERILDISGAGRADGSSYFPTEKAFDAQPSYLDQGVPELVDGGDNAPAYSDRVGYIDFGENWFDYRISKVWTLYRTWSGGSHIPYAEVWWDDDIDMVNDSQLTESDLNFNSASDLSGMNEKQWVLDGDFTSEPIIPSGRYLMLRSPSSMTSRATEYALVGWKQDEVDILNQAPIVSITAPNAGIEFTVDEVITVTVDTSDDGVVGQVDYYLDDTLIGSSNVAPFDFDMTISTSGEATITAVAFDDAGLSTTSNAVSVYVNAAIRVIQPLAAGKAEGSQYFPMHYAFDTPPTYEDGVLGLLNEGQRAPYYSGRYGYIDFGPDWQSIQILQTHTLYRPWSAGDHTPYVELWWDDENDVVNDGITEAQINFNSATGLSAIDETQWVIDGDFSQLPITPQGRYLLLKAPESMTGRALEYAIIGR